MGPGKTQLSQGKTGRERNSYPPVTDKNVTIGSSCDKNRLKFSLIGAEKDLKNSFLSEKRVGM